MEAKMDFNNGNRVSHFIPSVELTGSRADKLQRLDTLIAYLEQLRRSLTGNTTAGRASYEGPGLYVDSPSWPWLTVGAMLGALFLLGLLAARIFA